MMYRKASRSLKQPTATNRRKSVAKSHSPLGVIPMAPHCVAGAQPAAVAADTSGSSGGGSSKPEKPPLQPTSPRAGAQTACSVEAAAAPIYSLFPKLRAAEMLLTAAASEPPFLAAGSSGGPFEAGAFREVVDATRRVLFR
jgi:hypothetical protein